MNNPHYRVPNTEGATGTAGSAPNAALLIDFDNVTMGMRSDLSKELKTLLQSDVIKGKVTVQRAYADWRRYPQYIVPLSEASVDLIFAPAYGSSKKNATDIRMAIDAIELVFVRPEIGTFILLTGDSDFSSLVLKLKEYGKYVIGVGIQESSSDILVQNCDEYYSYTSITGLTKTTEATGKATDAWMLVEKAVDRMISRGDVMRSDRLKQVMIEIDGNFAEGNFGFSKFSRFLAEAASRKLVRLHKMPNGQYEIAAPGASRRESGKGAEGKRGSKERDDRRRSGRRGRGERTRRDEPMPEKAAVEEAAAGEAPEPKPGEVGEDPLRDAYGLLREALEAHAEAGREWVRDSDVKRKMLELHPGFDEGELGFGKFSRFLRQAGDHGVVGLDKLQTGNYRISLGSGDASVSEAEEQEPVWEVVEGSGRTPIGTASSIASSEPEDDSPGTVVRVEAPRVSGLGRRSSGLGRKVGEIQLLEDQIIGTGPSSPPELGVESEEPGGGARRTRPDSGTAAPPDPEPPSDVDLSSLNLPRDKEAIIQYLTNSYKGVGGRTAEVMVESFGADVFRIFHEEPERLRQVVPRRAEQVLEAWRADLARRAAGGNGGREEESHGWRVGGRRTRRGGGRQVD
jgi:uncharacterized protein (TIGR00288 family)